MKGHISITGLISKSNKEELKLIYNLIKNHSHFTGDRKKLYTLIVKHKNNKNNK